MKTIFLFFAITFSVITTAQVTKVSLQASGLTCSMCSNSINKALYTLDFVEKIDADIKTYTFEISFKPNSNVDFGRIRKKVENAGFAVSSFVATVNFDNVLVPDSHQIAVGGQTFLLINVRDEVLIGTRQVTILNKGFVSAKQYKKNPISFSSEDVYHASL